MSKTQINDTAAVTGNVQGFELPRGCLMTTGLILLPIVTLVIAVANRL